MEQIWEFYATNVQKNKSHSKWHELNLSRIYKLTNTRHKVTPSLQMWGTTFMRVIRLLLQGVRIWYKVNKASTRLLFFDNGDFCCFSTGFLPSERQNYSINNKYMHENKETGNWLLCLILVSTLRVASLLNSDENVKYSSLTEWTTQRS